MVTNQLPTGRAWWKFILLGIVTFGIYPLVVLCKISTEINTVAGPHDGQKTLHFIVVALLSALHRCCFALCSYFGYFASRLVPQIEQPYWC